MGINTPENQTPASYGAQPSPYQQAALKGLLNTASTPYQGAAPGGGAATGAAQIAAALMAAQRARQWKNKFNVPTYNNPGLQPGQVSAPAALPGSPTSQSMDLDPNSGIGTYA